MENRGKIIAERIKEFGIKPSHIFNKLGISKTTLRVWINTPNLPDRDVERIGNIIRHDFSIDIASFKKTLPESEIPSSQAADAATTYAANTELMQTLLKELEQSRQREEKLQQTLDTILTLLKNKS